MTTEDTKIAEALRFDGTKESANQILGWIGANGGDAKRVHSRIPERGIEVRTLDGVSVAGPGDWIIRGINGGFYTCHARPLDGRCG